MRGWDGQIQVTFRLVTQKNTKNTRKRKEKTITRKYNKHEVTFLLSKKKKLTSKPTRKIQDEVTLLNLARIQNQKKIFIHETALARPLRDPSMSQSRKQTPRLKNKLKSEWSVYSSNKKEKSWFTQKTKTKMKTKTKTKG